MKKLGAFVVGAFLAVTGPTMAQTVTGVVVSVQPGTQETGCFKWTARLQDGSEVYAGVMNGTPGDVSGTVNAAFGQTIRFDIGAPLNSCNDGRGQGAPFQATHVSRSIP